jgi:hypothetical protein
MNETKTQRLQANASTVRHNLVLVIRGQVGRGRPVALRGDESVGELPGRGTADLRLGAGSRVHRPPPVPARTVDVPSGALREAGIPKDVSFATKPEQAVELLQEADDAQVPFGWVAVDGGYGQYLRHEVARGEWVRRLEGRDVVDGVTSSLCLWLVPTVTCVAGDGWVRSSRESPRALVPSGGHRRGEGWVWGD